MPYKTELHMHTNNISVCAHATPEQAILSYQKSGYRTIVVTNHMNRPAFSHMEKAPWEEKIAWFLQEQKRIQQYATADFSILTGFELRFDENHNDYLIYGASDEFLLRHGDLMSMTLQEFRPLAQENGILIYQAHPFRHKMTLMDETLLDGLEAYYGNERHQSHNFLTVTWANYTHLSMISGSDYHRPHDPCNGGILTPEPITDISGLMKVLKECSYQLLRG